MSDDSHILYINTLLHCQGTYEFISGMHVKLLILNIVNTTQYSHTYAKVSEIKLCVLETVVDLCPRSIIKTNAIAHAA